MHPIRARYLACGPEVAEELFGRDIRNYPSWKYTLERCKRALNLRENGNRDSSFEVQSILDQIRDLSEWIAAHEEEFQYRFTKSSLHNISRL